MTEKLFWQDPYRTQFDAEVLQEFDLGGRNAVVLDQTCFYPTSGGQPNDRGSLNSVPVDDVLYHGDQLVHITKLPLGGKSVTGVIDWKRRFDHMQQHSGQHILSAAFFNLFQAETSSFHLGQEYCSIELNRRLTELQILDAEQTANEVVLAFTPVNAFFVDPEKAKDYPLRKQSDLAEALRLIQIGDFDLSPCSGTHVRNAAEVGLIFVQGHERLSQTTRITFVCGLRVHEGYKKDLQVLKTLSKSLTTSFELLPDSVLKLQGQIKELRKEVTQLKEAALKKEADDFIKAFKTEHRIVRVLNRPYTELRILAQQLSNVPEMRGAIASITDRRIVFFKDQRSSFDLRKAFTDFQSQTAAKGGGPAHFIEAGNWKELEDLETVLLKLF